MANCGLPLPEHVSICVMHFELGAFKDVIHFRLEIIYLLFKASKVAYEAISCTWDEATLLKNFYHRNATSANLTTVETIADCHDALKSLKYTDRI